MKRLLKSGRANWRMVTGNGGYFIWRFKATAAVAAGKVALQASRCTWVGSLHVECRKGSPGHCRLKHIGERQKRYGEDPDADQHTKAPFSLQLYWGARRRRARPSQLACDSSHQLTNSHQSVSTTVIRFAASDFPWLRGPSPRCISLHVAALLGSTSESILVPRKISHGPPKRR